MTSVFRTAGAWGAGLGRPLTWAEQDNNTYDKETRLLALENPATGAGPVGIDHISVSGNQMTIYLTDSSVQGPFELPSATWSAKGEWQPSHAYLALDTVSYGNSVYLVNVNHTSATSFDPNETIGAVQVYSPLFSFPTVPQGINESGSTFTPTIDHANMYIRLTNPAGCAVTIDPSVGFAPWTQLHFRDASSTLGASCTFAIDSPGTINPVGGYHVETFGPGSVATLKKVGSTDAWDIFGLLAPI